MAEINPEKFEARQETREARPEQSQEAKEALDYQGAELLEEPQGGSFVSAMQAFVAWVNNLVADDK